MVGGAGPRRVDSSKRGRSLLPGSRREPGSRGGADVQEYKYEEAEGHTIQTQSHRRYNGYDCGFGQGYDDAWIHENDLADAQYLGYCLP